MEKHFEIWTDGNNKVLVYTYTYRGESFASWTTEKDVLPKTDEEGEMWVHVLDWEVENMDFLRKSGFKKIKETSF